MKEIYKWNIVNYNWKEFWWLHVFNGNFYIEDTTYKIKWLWSKKKNKYYYKLDVTICGTKYMFIIFKNWYILIFDMWKPKTAYWKIRDYYHRIVNWQVEQVDPKIEMPF